MNITVQYEIDKDEFSTFGEAENFCFETGLKIARELMVKFLEASDAMFLADRDSKKYRNKGFRKTCIKTLMGDVEYQRRVYEDLAAEGKSKTVYLLDEALKIEKVGLVTAALCKKVTEITCESTYRAASRQISASRGQRLSHQAIWNLTQKLGIKQVLLTERNAELAEAGTGWGTIETQILYEEADGIWLKLQGESRNTYGPTREMKLGIAYDGVTYVPCKNGKIRRVLDNKVAVAGFMPAKKFKAIKEGAIADKYDVGSIQLRVANGDGAQWIQKSKGERKICVLDAYHRNKKITECAGDPEFAQTLFTLLYEKKIDQLFECIEAQINSVEEPAQIEKLQELYDYFSNNRQALLGYYERGETIPETRLPGVIHHARLGSMESNVFTLIGNRMKGRRAVWSIAGANNLAALLCAYHTTGLGNLFPALPEIPKQDSLEQEYLDWDSLSASKAPFSEGHGNEYTKNVSTTNGPSFLRGISQFASFSNLSFC